MLFLSLIAWHFGARALAASAASGLAFRFRLVMGEPVLAACFHLFLLLVGFVVLDVVARRVVPLRELAGLPKRATERHEWLTGAALGWGMVMLVVLPIVLFGRMHADLSFGLDDVKISLVALVVLGVSALTHEITFRGYPFRCLIDAVGESVAVILMVLGAGVSAWHHAWVPGTGVIASMLLTLLLSLTWLRTRAIWFAWGVHFALVAAGSVLFGLPLGSGVGLSSVVRSTVYGADWLTGGDFGPAASLFTVVVLLLAIPLLYRLTREYAWLYTHAPIVAGGYEVTVAPPAAHTAVEQQTAKAPALVQILSTTPTTLSANVSGGPTARPEPLSENE